MEVERTCQGSVDNGSSVMEGMGMREGGGGCFGTSTKPLELRHVPHEKNPSRSDRDSRFPDDACTRVDDAYDNFSFRVSRISR
jgi:hypothetical protein